MTEAPNKAAVEKAIRDAEYVLLVLRTLLASMREAEG